MRVTLLGTGTPVPDPARRGPAQLVDAGGDLLLVDCGSGAVQRLVEAGYVAPGRLVHQALPLRRIALTHLHTDHVTGLPDLLWSGWIFQWWDVPPVVVGPPGTAAFLERLVAAFAADVRARSRPGRGPESLVPRVEEVEDGWQEAGTDWRLTAFRVEHPPVDQAFGFRVDAPAGAAGAVVFSGDTRRSANLIRHARGADLLVHEVYSRTGLAAQLAGVPDPQARARLERIVDFHTGSDQVGQVAAEAGVHRLVLTHAIFGAGGTPADVLADVARAFPGPASVGEDLQTFVVSDDPR
jgi:ribonuclease Z